MKKIVFVITSLQNLGGTERVVTFLANELSKYYEITILSQKVNANSKTFPLESQVTDIRLESSAIKFPLAVKKYINLNSPDLVVIHTMTKLTPILLLLGTKSKNLWSLEHTSYLFSSKTYRLLRKFLYSRLTKVVTLTEKDKIHYKKINKNVNVIYNASPIPITQSHYCSDSKTVVSIGQLEDHKGFDLLLKAWKPIDSLHPDWTLHIYGKGSKLEILKQYCKTHNLKSVRFMGLTDKPHEVYDSAAIYVMCSRFEGLGLVLLEAQSRGLPTVSFDCPYGPSEIINNNKDGFLVPPENIENMTEALLKLIENATLREQYSRAALDNAKKFEKQHIIKKWIDMIEEEV